MALVEIGRVPISFEFALQVRLHSATVLTSSPLLLSEPLHLFRILLR